MSLNPIRNIAECSNSLSTQVTRLDDVLRGIPHVNKDDDPMYAGVGAKDMEIKIKGISKSIINVIECLNAELRKA